MYHGRHSYNPDSTLYPQSWNGSRYVPIKRKLYGMLLSAATYIDLRAKGYSVSSALDICRVQRVRSENGWSIEVTPDSYRPYDGCQQYAQSVINRCEFEHNGRHIWEPKECRRCTDDKTGRYDGKRFTCKRLDGCCYQDDWTMFNVDLLDEDGKLLQSIGGVTFVDNNENDPYLLDIGAELVREELRERETAIQTEQRLEREWYSVAAL